MKNIIVTLGLIFAASSAAAGDYDYFHCEGLTASGKTIKVNVCLGDTTVETESYSKGEVSECQDGEEFPPTGALVYKTLPGQKTVEKELKIGTGSYWYQTEDQLEVFVTDFNGDLEGVDLESEGYKTIRMFATTEQPGTFTVNLGVPGWTGFSFGNAYCQAF